MKDGSVMSWSVKQHGALLAKGWLLGLQFDTLFTDGLYAAISRHAVELALQLRGELAARGYEFYIDSPTNQQFVVLSAEDLRRLSEKVEVTVWERLEDGRAVVRLATSWATTHEQVEALMALL